MERWCSTPDLWRHQPSLGQDRRTCSQLKGGYRNCRFPSRIHAFCGSTEWMHDIFRAECLQYLPLHCFKNLVRHDSQDRPLEVVSIPQLSRQCLAQNWCAYVGALCLIFRFLLAAIPAIAWGIRSCERKEQPPTLRIKLTTSQPQLLEIMSISAIVGCLLVWASQCLAFIRYWLW